MVLFRDDEILHMGLDILKSRTIFYSKFDIARQSDKGLKQLACEEYDSLVDSSGYIPTLYNRTCDPSTLHDWASSQNNLSLTELKNLKKCIFPYTQTKNRIKKFLYG